MPTPSDDNTQVLRPTTPESPHLRPSHTTCPPEDIRHQQLIEVSNEAILTGREHALPTEGPQSPRQQPTPPPDGVVDSSTDHSAPALQHTKSPKEAEDSLQESPRPGSTARKPKQRQPLQLPARSPGSPHPVSNVALTPDSEPSPFPATRFLPNSTSSFLRPSSRFHGSQQSDRHVYDVQVELKHVDMDESFLCGYLRIQGLTDDIPTLTTYFEGEIIGSKHSFITRHPEWGSNEKVDMQHWNRFPAFRPLAKQARRSEYTYKNWGERENIFMRWKEYFLVPDHRVRTINGASFEGFYYICFNQVSGSVSGIYFHAKSEKQVILYTVPTGSRANNNDQVPATGVNAC